MSLSLRFAIKYVIVLVGLTSPKVDILESVENFDTSQGHRLPHQPLSRAACFGNKPQVSQCL